MAAAATLAGSSLAGAAEEPPPFSRTELVDTWGSILYCLAVYEEPGVEGRIYQGDLRSCETAGQVVAGIARRDYSEPEVQQIALEAGRKASIIRYNTRSIQDAVFACRQQCRNLAAFSDKGPE